MLAVLCLGANLGDRGETIERALDAISRLPHTRLCRRSALYETAPEGVSGSQPDYINCIAEVDTQLPPEGILGACFGIEAANGRVRVGEKSPRTLDIDLLLYEGVQSSDPKMLIPHPRMLERRFVLEPLAELYPEHIALGLDFSSEYSKIFFR